MPGGNCTSKSRWPVTSCVCDSTLTNFQSMMLSERVGRANMPFLGARPIRCSWASLAKEGFSRHAQATRLGSRSWRTLRVTMLRLSEPVNRAVGPLKGTMIDVPLGYRAAMHCYAPGQEHNRRSKGRLGTQQTRGGNARDDESVTGLLCSLFHFTGCGSGDVPRTCRSEQPGVLPEQQDGCERQGEGDRVETRKLYLGAGSDPRSSRQTTSSRPSFGATTAAWAMCRRQLPLPRQRLAAEIRRQPPADRPAGGVHPGAPRTPADRLHHPGHADRPTTTFTSCWPL